MKVKYIDDVTPRTDNQRGRPTGITIGNVYVVAEIAGDKFSIMNDDMKLCRYSTFRFVVVDDTPVKPLRENFNSLTTCMRTRIKELEKMVNALQAANKEN